MFRSEENKRYFLQQFSLFTGHILQPFAWSLLPNHFHFQVRARETTFVIEKLSAIDEKKRTSSQEKFLLGQLPYHLLASSELKRFFQSYSLSLNNQQRRNGNLFYKRFRCIEIEDEDQFRKTMVYIHTNPVKHGLITDFTDYKWSSWNEYDGRIKSILDRSEVYRIFGNKQAFLTAHQVQQQYLIDKWRYDL